jgi:hypothetical protein
MRRGDPRRRGRGSGAEVDTYTGISQEGDDLVEVVELEVSGARLDLRPSEDVDGDKVDAGLLHEPHVVGPDGAVPLFRVVVTAEDEPIDVEPKRAGGRGEWDGHCGLGFIGVRTALGSVRGICAGNWRDLHGCWAAAL